MAGTTRHHVLIKAGDASAEVEAAIRASGSAARAGLHRFFYVSRANQTVVMATEPAAPVVQRLRTTPGWSAPEEV